MIERIINIDRDLLAPMKELGEDFFAEADLPGSFKLQTFLQSWRVILANGHGAMWKAVDYEGYVTGLFGALLSYDLNNGAVIAAEAFWYVKKEFRGKLDSIRLFKTFEQWGTDIGATRFQMTHLLTENASKLEEFYTRNGYRAIEINYIKEP